MRSIAKLMQDWQFTGPDGKTTLVDEMLKQSGIFRENQQVQDLSLIHI